MRAIGSRSMRWAGSTSASPRQARERTEFGLSHQRDIKHRRAQQGADRPQREIPPLRQRLGLGSDSCSDSWADSSVSHENVSVQRVSMTIELIATGWPALMAAMVFAGVPTRDEMARPAIAVPTNSARTTIFR